MHIRGWSFLLSFLVFFAVTFSDGGEAFGSSSGVIEEIKIEGNQRIERQTVLSQLGLKAGNFYDSEALDKALKNLFGTGFFADATLHREGRLLTVRVVENPIVNQLALEGNDEISDDILKGELQLRARQVYTLTRLKNDTQRIQDIYRLKGHFAAVVTPRIIRREQNRVDVIFEIEEGKPTVVQKIFFIGNKKYSESKLESILQTKETRWYRFFTSDDNYDPDRVAYDRELLRRFYLQHGYADFRVKSAVAELTPDQKEFFITFTLDEGERYTFGKVDVISEVKDVDVESFRPHLTMSEGDWYNSKEVERTVTKITNELGNRGYAFVDVKPRVTKDAEGLKVHINFEIEEGPRVYIEKIQVVGNIRTNEEVIRRELRFQEGDAFNAHHLKLSERRLKNLGFFKTVKINKEPSNAPDKLIIVIEVEEDRTGELSLAGGFSTTDGPLIELGFAERNLRGKGQDARVKATLAKRRQEYDLSFTEPYFMDRDIAAGIDIYHIRQNRFFEQSFDHKIYGLTLRAGYLLSEFLRQSWSYSLQREEISGIKGDASRFLRQQDGKSVLSSLTHVLHYDRRDSRINPTEGYHLGMKNAFAGLGGDIRYFKNVFSAGWFYPVMDDVVFSLSGEYGILFEIGKKLRAVDRFLLGGDSFRGFETSGIGPRDRRTLDALGGTQFYKGTAELTFPIGLPNEFGVKGAVFADAGSVYNPKLPSADVIDTRSLRASAGAGVRWKSPMGPIKIDFAKALLKDEHDREKMFLFGFSTRF